MFGTILIQIIDMFHTSWVRQKMSWEYTLNWMLPFSFLGFSHGYAHFGHVKRDLLSQLNLHQEIIVQRTKHFSFAWLTLISWINKYSLHYWLIIRCSQKAWSLVQKTLVLGVVRKFLLSVRRVLESFRALHFANKDETNISTYLR